ncbi:hypothetical protein L1887_18491 [Cichorium endivia]|nr:hypothetical protein L1887_18491 [Cichorium endivia]
MVVYMAISSRASETRLTWPQQKSIILDVAKRLSHLHHEIKHAIFHCNIKATNVLLDSNMKVVIPDFGLAKQSRDGQSPILDGHDPRVDEGPASNHLESPNSLNCTLNQLQTVEITSLNGSRPEMLFIKLLLANSPSLKEFNITPYGTCDAQKRLAIGKDVMEFPRASPTAEIILESHITTL